MISVVVMIVFFVVMFGMILWLSKYFDRPSAGARIQVGGERMSTVREEDRKHNMHPEEEEQRPSQSESEAHSGGRAREVDDLPNVDHQGPSWMSFPPVQHGKAGFDQWNAAIDLCHSRSFLEQRCLQSRPASAGDT